MVRRALVALTGTGTHYPEGSLLVDCQTISFENIEALAQRRAAIRDDEDLSVASLSKARILLWRAGVAVQYDQ